MEEIPQKFFDLSQPCPPEIKDCENLRELYKAELESLKSQGICSSCVERGLRNKYIAAVLTNYNKL